MFKPLSNILNSTGSVIWGGGAHSQVSILLGCPSPARARPFRVLFSYTSPLRASQFPRPALFGASPSPRDVKVPSPLVPPRALQTPSPPSRPSSSGTPSDALTPLASLSQTLVAFTSSPQPLLQPAAGPTHCTPPRGEGS